MPQEHSSFTYRREWSSDRVQSHKTMEFKKPCLWAQQFHHILGLFSNTQCNHTLMRANTDLMSIFPLTSLRTGKMLVSKYWRPWLFCIQIQPLEVESAREQHWGIDKVPYLKVKPCDSFKFRKVRISHVIWSFPISSVYRDHMMATLKRKKMCRYVFVCMFQTSIQGPALPCKSV